MNSSDQRPPYICYVAGKSGGHIIPALTHARFQKQANSALKVLFFSTNSPLDRSLLEHTTLIDTYKPLALGNIPRKNIFAWPRFCMQLMTVLWQSCNLLRTHRPTKVVSMGGYISVPVCFVARLLRIPVEVYELNVVPGAAVKLLSRWADRVHLCFGATRIYLPIHAHCVQGAYPLRYTESERLERTDACQTLGISPEKKIILVAGGSQGSRFINEIMQKYVRTKERSDRCVIIHQTGAADVHTVKQGYRECGIDAIVFAYRDDIHLCYAAADVVVARAGAGTLFELLFFKKSSLIIPLETATTDHQKDNALSMLQEHPQLFKVFLQAEVEKQPEEFFQQLSLFCQ